MENGKDMIFDVVETENRILEINADLEEVNEESKYKVMTDSRINIEELLNGDDEPMFATVEVLRNGMSKNKRNYSVSVVQDLMNKVVGTVGYLGHSDARKMGFEFREPQSIYVGSSLVQEEDGTVRLLGKSYIFKNSPLREWLPKSIACGSPMSVSIQGKAKCFENLDKTIDVQTIVDLESIDWCNPKTQGMSNSINLSLTTEMVENPNSIIITEKGDVKMAEEKILEQEVIETPVVEEVEETVEEVVTEETVIETEETVTEQIEEVSEMEIKFSEMETKISEMETTIAEKNSRIAELEREISEIRAEQERVELESYKAEKIAEQIDEAHRESFAKRINGKSKEEIDSQISELIDFVKEMGGLDNPVPAPVKKVNNDDDLREQVIRLFAGK